jgi:hypothetical protein
MEQVDGVTGVNEILIQVDELLPQLLTALTQMLLAPQRSLALRLLLKLTNILLVP